MMYITTANYRLKVLDPRKNKQACYMLANYFRWDKDSTIWTIYKKPCYENEKAFCELRSQMRSDNGFDLRCGNPTCHSWNLAYQIPGAGESGAYLIYHTRRHVRCIYIPSAKPRSV